MLGGCDVMSQGGSMQTQRKINQERRGNWTTKMATLKIEAFFQEFKWLRNFIPRNALVKFAYVSRIEPALLDWEPVEELNDDPEQIFFVDEGGDVVEIKRTTHPRKWWLFGPRVTTWTYSSLLPRGFTIGAALREMDKRADKVRFILSYCRFTEAIIVYKAPKGVTIPDWIERQIKAEGNAIQKSCREIDEEAKELPA